MAGPATAAAGATLLRDLTQDAVMGFWRVVGSLGTWWHVLATSFARWRVDPPQALLTVDFPGLNVRLARAARRRGVVVRHLVAPQLFAHSPWRAWRWRRAVDEVLGLMPFDRPLLGGSRIPTHYVGHPLFEAPVARRIEADAPFGSPATIEVWPGSRRQEIDAIAPLLARFARHIAACDPGVRFVARLARAEDAPRFDAAWQRGEGPPLAREAVAPLRGALACSGTATAQLACAGIPHVGIYAASRGARCLAWLYVTAPYILLPNLIAGREVVPEAMLSSQGEADRWARTHLEALLAEGAWRAQRERLALVRQRLVTDQVAERIAGHVLAPRPVS